MAKIGECKLTNKAKISKAFGELRKYGYKIFNFNNKGRIQTGYMKDWVDIVIAGHGRIYFIEVKIGKDKHSEGQLETKEKLISCNATYLVVTENNYLDTIQKIIGD